MFETDTEKAQQIQSDVLLESTANNPYFTAHKVPAKNKALNTTDKKIVGAINELLKKQNSLQNAVQNSINQSFDATGDIISHPDLLERLREISPSLIEAVCDHEEKINALQELVEELKNKKSTSVNNANSNQTITIDGMNWDFGEDDMGNLNALLNVTGKNIKDLEIQVKSVVSPGLSSREIPIKFGETVEVLTGTDLTTLAPSRATNLKYYNYNKEDQINLYANFDGIDLDTSSPGERDIPCVPEMGYYSTKGMPFFKVKINEVEGPQVIGIVYGEDGYTYTITKIYSNSNDVKNYGINVSPKYYQIDQNYNIHNLIGEGIRIFKNFKEIKDPNLGYFIEIPTLWVKTEILTEGPFAGKLCWWIADGPVGGFHVHSAFLKPDGTYGNLQLSKYIMQHHKNTTTTPYSVLGSYTTTANTNTGESNGYSIDTIKFVDIPTREEYMKSIDPAFHLMNIYEYHLITRLMHLEFCNNLYFASASPYKEVTKNTIYTYETKANRNQFHGIYDPTGPWKEAGGNNSYILIKGLETDEDGMLMIYKADGSEEFANTGLNYSVTNYIPAGNFMTGNINGINFDDLYIIDMENRVTTSNEFIELTTATQAFGKDKFCYCGDYYKPLNLRTGVKSTSTTLYAWRACRVV